MWVKYVNEENGGVNGHQVVFLVYDDGGDPARHQAQVREAVEHKGAIAFLQNGESITGHASVDYINSKRIPVIGLTGAESWGYTTPMYFPQASVGDVLARALTPAAASIAIPAGKTKLGTLICVEADVCQASHDAIRRDAKTYGFDHVYQARASVAQPDFTAECLAARNAGVTTFYVLLDSASITRVARACGRQAYQPLYATGGAGLADYLKDDPELAGAVSSTYVFPYFQTNTPATAEFQHAFRKYGKGIVVGNNPALGWVSGKLFERATAHLPEPPTSAAILAGLWTLRDDSLGGLTQPLTFVENQPAKPLTCWFNVVVKDKQWTSPDNFERHCL